MEDGKEHHDTKAEQKPDLVQKVFSDFDARNNIVSLFDLLLRIDKRINQKDYQIKTTQ